MQDNFTAIALYKIHDLELDDPIRGKTFLLFPIQDVLRADVITASSPSSLSLGDGS